MSEQPSADSTHVVRAGETLNGIARQHNVTLPKLLAANPDIRNPDLIRVGQILRIPADTAAPVSESASAVLEVHIVQAGDTLTALALQRHITLAALLAVNPQVTNPNMISVGQRIFMPRGETVVPPEPDTPSEADAQAANGGNAHAILLEFQSAGASDKTARQDGLPQRGITGVRASETMAQTDRHRVMQHKEKFEVAARRFGLPPALLAALASRESRGGAALDQRGEGDHGHGFGLMQVDNRNPFNVVRDGGPFGQPHINQATGILHDKLTTARGLFPALSPAQHLQVAVSRYNGGRGLPPPNSDSGTTGGDYMHDVWARARFYVQVETWSDSPSTAAPPETAAPVGTAAAPPSTVSTPLPAAPAAVGTSTFGPAPSLDAVRQGGAVLAHGQQGDAVRHVQLLLGVDADTKFGQDTEDAVVNFQRAHTVETAPDTPGTIGPATLAVLEKAGEAALNAMTLIDPRHKTGDIHPEFRRRLSLMAAALSRRDLHATITEGMRTFAQQDAIHAQGRMPLAEVNALRAAAGLGPIPADENVRRTDKRGGFSNHNYGLAVDLYPVVNGRLFTEVPADPQLAARVRETRQAIGEEAERVGCTWGGRWERLHDTPHVQLLPLNILPPEECHTIFQAHGEDMSAVWAVATQSLTDVA